tara:strand:- start:656 stop:1489 length:834 start_codon:yes stop_codon:yes gene_type:complete
MKIIKSIKDIADYYDTFLIDQWGVMHDGNNGFKHAIETIDFLENKNKKLIVISNSSKRKQTSLERLPLFGFRKNSFVEVQTSGELIWNIVNNMSFNQSKKITCLHIFDDTKEDGLGFRKGLKNILFTDNVKEADFVLACTPYINLKPVDYIPLLNEAFKKNLVMYCANPDYETIEKKNNIFCMGLIGKLYEEIGGKVIIKGKPDKSIYEESTKKINLDKSKTVAIGDSLFHDIKGANLYGIDSVLVTSGIHSNLTNVNKLVNNHKIIPNYFIKNFSI